MGWVGLGGLVGIAIVVVIINVANEFESDASPRDMNICFTKCTWLREKECGSNIDIT